MSTNTEQRGSVAGTGEKSTDEFAGCLPKAVTVTKVMDAGKSKLVWDRLYSSAGVANQGEQPKKALRCGVYMYLAINGTSPAGTYKGTITTGTGVVLRASEIPAAAGSFEVRQFARANAEESLRFFRHTAALETDAAIRAKCEEMEIPPSDAIGFVDWFDVAVGLTPTERESQKRLKNYGLGRARRARDGKNLEEIRADHYQDSLNAQGSERAPLPQSSGW